MVISIWISDQELQFHFKSTLEAYGTVVDRLFLISVLRDDLSEWLVESLTKEI